MRRHPLGCRHGGDPAVTPDPYVRNQAALLLVGLAALTLIGASGLALGLTGGVALAGGLLLYADRRAIAQVGAVVPPHRGIPDRLVLRSVVAVAVVGLLLGAASLALSEPVLSVDSEPASACIKAVACALAGILLGSLVDWWWVLPRITGLLGVRPCQPANSGRGSPRRLNWEEVTRYWYLNRIVAAVVVMVAGAVLVFNLMRLVLGGGAATTTLAGAGGVLALLAEAYRQHLPWGVMEMLNPHARVGDTIAVDGQTAWTVDVSMEGVKYIDYAEHNQRWQARLSSSVDERVRYEPKFDGSIPLTEAKKIRHRSIPRPCPAGGCTGASWYCIDNPRCFEKPD
jgi:hypothetical protein